MKQVIIPDGYVGQYTVTKSNRDYTLEKGSELHDNGNNGGIVESASFSGNVFHINGVVVNNIFPIGVALGFGGAESNIVIGKSADITGFNSAISLFGTDQVLVNNGDLSSSVAGIYATGSGKTIVNNGDITAGTGLELTGAGTVTNNGVIDAGVAGIRWVDSSSTLTLGKTSEITSDGPNMGNGLGVIRDNDMGIASRTVNSGAITAANFSFSGLEGNETLINRGTMSGDVYLGNGDDTFDNRKGTLTGEVDGGSGSDTYFMGAKPFSIIEVDGAAGTDTLKSTITRHLEAGWDIENLYLLGKANINAYGDASANHVFGNKGNNYLAGLEGADELTGGTGKDTFLFRTDDGTDKIMDFENGVDKIDLSIWDSVSSFADIKDKGYLFYVDGNTVITDGMGEELTLVDFRIGKLDRTDFVF